MVVVLATFVRGGVIVAGAGDGELARLTSSEDSDRAGTSTSTTAGHDASASCLTGKLALEHLGTNNCLGCGMFLHVRMLLMRMTFELDFRAKRRGAPLVMSAKRMRRLRLC